MGQDARVQGGTARHGITLRAGYLAPTKPSTPLAVQATDTAPVLTALSPPPPISHDPIVNQQQLLPVCVGVIVPWHVPQQHHHQQHTQAVHRQAAADTTRGQVEAQQVSRVLLGRHLCAVAMLSHVS